jgi:hypothetical protein
MWHCDVVVIYATGTKWDLPFHFYRPSLQKYGPYQWLWDSGSHQIVWSHRNVSNSIADLRTMLQFQQPDGRIPEIIFWGPQVVLLPLLFLISLTRTQFIVLVWLPCISL